jgi:hypothetical protein
VCGGCLAGGAVLGVGGGGGGGEDGGGGSAGVVGPGLGLG